MNLLEKSIELYLGVKAAKVQTDPMFLQIRDFIVHHFAHEGTRALAVADDIPIVYLYKGTSGGRSEMRAFQHPLNVNKNRPQEDEVTPQTNIDEAPTGLALLQGQYAEIGRQISQLKYGDPQIQYLVGNASRIKSKMNALSSSTTKADTLTPEPVKTGNTQQSAILTKRAEEDRARREAAKETGKPSRQQSVKKAAVADKNEKFEKPTPAQPGETGKVGDVVKVPEMPDVDVEKIRDMRAKGVTQVYPPESLKKYLAANGVTLTGGESHTQLASRVLQHIKGQ